ncbi:aldehyde dehydrogenase (NADP(+)) [Achromobacter sp. GG226]|uniref:aldehyde dehydrogenase (NADP(+)) n=1 Tax=Verticiella alkaliphila TaxID=2779529 RepID=UPI001C0AFDBD|nr:aldehyde dehydrogenase (NADP(+)) [Verticiella sp. GG226]MBU4610881.1 aldehyde dehydrogenase (NADP(+)) [Verticiella sp. GG226]
MALTGNMIIGRDAVRGTEGVQRAYDPTRDQHLDTEFGLGGKAEVERAAALAQAAFDPYRALSPTRRAEFLDAIAQSILDLGDELIERAHAESALPVARLTGERGRTVGQLRLFAQVLRDGHYLHATIDQAQPQRQPLPRSDLRLARIPVGPVAVFGASNFPLAFSVAGGDTASALAAGCPVIVKAHSAHLGTSELVGQAIQKAAIATDMPEGVFSLLFGAGRSVGEALVAHPVIQAVGFTGSRQGGLALVNIANNRPQPIPVYAEMSSINPVFLLPAALQSRADAIGRGFADSLTMGAGQFCTNPGLVIAEAGAGLDRFLASATEALAAKPATTMLTDGIHRAYDQGVSSVSSQANVTCAVQGQQAQGPNAARAALFVTDAESFLGNEALQAEMFGPASVVVRVRDAAEMRRVAEHLEGQLTATIQLDDADIDAARALLPVLERKAGRILANGFPTGVEVSHAMVHGGPFPSTSSALHTSVGASAIDRFVRPVCYQDLPDALRPDALKDANPLDVWRLVDGQPVAPKA